MSRTRPKPYWWHWKVYANPGKAARRLQRKGDRRVRQRETARLIDEQH